MLIPGRGEREHGNAQDRIRSLSSARPAITTELGREADMTQAATLGHNNPPEPTPYEAAMAKINDLYDEARLWLDGDPITSQDMADDLSNLLTMIRAAEKEADDARKIEKKPFDDGAKEVQARYKPLLDKAARASDVCKKALADWLRKQEAERQKQAEAARKEAEEKARAAAEAHRMAATNLEASEAAEALIDEAIEARKAAKRIEADTAKAGNMGRAVSLRTVRTAVLTNLQLAACHYWTARPDELAAALTKIAEADIRAGKRDIPGFEIKEERIAQ